MKKVKNLFKWGKGYIPAIILILGLTIMLQLFYSYIPLFIQTGIKALEGGDLNVNLPDFLINFLKSQANVLSILLFLALFIIGLQAVRSIMRFADSYLRGRVTINIATDMRNAIYKHENELSYSYHNNVDIGDLIQRCTSDIETASNFIAYRVPDFIHIIATIIIGAYQVGSINITLMLVSMAILPLNAISSVVYFSYVNKSFIKIEEDESKMTAIIQENITSSRVVKAFANEKYEIEKMDKQSKKYADKSMKFNKVMAIYWGASDFSVMLQYVATVSVGIFLAKDGIVDAGDITACLMLMGMLIWPIRGLGRIISDFGKSLVAANRLEEILEHPSEYLVDGDLTPEIKGHIEFKNVSFKFDDSNNALLHDISFEIKKGETIAIVGRTGSGKSTIANLLTRFLDYDGGSILIDGVDLKAIQKKWIRSNIGIVLQDPFLYSKSIYENISISSNKLSTDQIYDAARVAAIHDDILNFEAGYETIVGEKGATLSGGQKQRVAIARTLISNKPIIIFDDSLSAVDTETDIQIRKALHQSSADTTTIIITHRTTTAKEADRIIVLENGYVSQIGTHQELVKEKGLYAKLWAIQGQLEEEFLKVLGGEE